jgi:hypothetical protein
MFSIVSRLPSTALLKRDLMRGLRRKALFWTVLLMLAIITWVLIAGWPEGRNSLTSAARNSRQCVGILMVGALIGFSFIIPGYAANTITSERERDTLELLRLTFIRPSGFLWAKLFDIWGMCLVVMLAVAPLGAATFFLVGLDMYQYATSLAVVVATMVSISCGSLLCSCLSKTASLALIRAYALAACLMGLPALLIAFLLEVSRNYQYMQDPILFTFIPIYTVMSILMEATPFSSTLWALIAHGAFSALCLLLSYALVRWRVWPAVGQKKGALRALSIRERGEAKQRGRKRWRRIYDYENPLYKKEVLYGELFRARRQLALLGGTILVLGFTVGCLVYGDADEEPFVAFSMIVGCIWSALVTPALIANLIPKEFAQQNMDMLRITLMTPMQHVIGKLLGGIQVMAPVYIINAILVVICLFPAVEDRDAFVYWLTGSVALFLTPITAATLAFYFSLMGKTVVRASIWAYTMVAFLFGGSICIVFLGYATLMGMFGHFGNNDFELIVRALLFVSPPGAYGMTIIDVETEHELGAYWFFHVAFMVVLNIGAVMSSVAHYRRRCMYDE